MTRPRERWFRWVCKLLTVVSPGRRNRVDRRVRKEKPALAQWDDDGGAPRMPAESAEHAG